MVSLKNLTNEPIEDEMRFSGLLQELLNAPATSMSAEEGFDLIDVMISRLCELLHGKHYRVAPVNPEVQAGETSTDPHDKVTLGTVESHKKFAHRGLVRDPGSEQNVVISVLGRIRGILENLKVEYMANDDLEERKVLLTHVVSKVKILDNILTSEVPPQGGNKPKKLTDLEHRDRLLNQQLKQWQLTQPRSDNRGQESTSWHGLTLRELNRSRKRQSRRKN